MLFSAGGRLCRGIIVTPTIFTPAFFTRLTMSSSGDDLCRRRVAAGIVGPHEEDDVCHTVVGQDVALETLEAGRAVR